VERRFGVLGCRTDGSLLRSTMRVRPWTNNPTVRNAGVLGLFLDHVLAEPLFLARKTDQWLFTTELAFDIVVPPPWTTTLLHATAHNTSSEADGGLTQGEVQDDHGRLIAVGSTWTQYVPATGSLRASPQQAPAAGDGNDAMSLADHLVIQTATDGGDTHVALADPQPWHNLYGRLHGGVWAAMFEMAAAESFTRAGGLRTSHVHICYLRPAAADAPVSAVARPLHTGRSFGVIQVTGSDDSGRTCVTATVTGRRQPN
jgi:uncharacterized protein (TIGR00369 family)